MTIEKRPGELLPTLIEELNQLHAAAQEDDPAVDADEWARALMSTSTAFLRTLAEFRDGVDKAGAIYPEEWFDQLESPDLDDPDLLAWHELCDWFSERSLRARGQEEEDD